MEESILEQIRRRGDKELVEICYVLIYEKYGNSHSVHKYGKHTQGDKGRDIVVLNKDNNKIIKISQMKFSVTNGDVSRLELEKELGKTLLHLLLDIREKKVSPINELIYTLRTNQLFSQSAINFLLEKSVDEKNSEISLNLFEKCQKESTRFDDLQYDTLKVEFEQLVSNTVVHLKGQDELVREIISNKSLLVWFDHITTDLSDLIDDSIQVDILEDGEFKFLKELEKIKYNPSDVEYTIAMDDYVMAYGVIHNISTIKSSVTYESIKWESYLNEILKNYNLIRSQFLRKKKNDYEEMIRVSKDFYFNVLIERPIINHGQYLIGSASIYRGLIHNLIDDKFDIKIERTWLLTDESK